MVKNGGTDYRPKGDPWRVNVHDFEDKKLGKVVPYGVYDMTTNAGFVSVGITSDTAEFVVRSIRCWRERIGRRAVRCNLNAGRAHAFLTHKLETDFFVRNWLIIHLRSSHWLGRSSVLWRDCGVKWRSPQLPMGT